MSGFRIFDGRTLCDRCGDRLVSGEEIDKERCEECQIAEFDEERRIEWEESRPDEPA